MTDAGAHDDGQTDRPLIELRQVTRAFQVAGEQVMATPVCSAALALISGLVAGAYPAARAARLDPVSTLQGRV